MLAGKDETGAAWTCQTVNGNFVIRPSAVEAGIVLKPRDALVLAAFLRSYLP